MTGTRSWRIGAIGLSRARLGIGIASERVSAVLLVHGAVRWCATERRRPDDRLSASLRSLLGSCPVARHMRPAVTFAIGPSAVQIKRTASLPALKDARALGALLQENAGRFFLTNGGAVLTTVRMESAEAMWIGAFDASVIEEARSFCVEAKWRRYSFVPTVLALVHAIRGDHASWVDGNVCATIHFAEQAVTRIQVVPAEAGVARSVMVVPELGTLGADAPCLADAYGAASLPLRPALILRPDRTAAPASRMGWRRTILAAMTLLATVAMALAAPTVRATVSARRDARQLSRLAARATIARSKADSLQDVTMGLADVAALAASGRSMLVTLAELTRALPDSVTLLSVQIDSAGVGVLVAVAPRASEVVDAVERVPDFASPSIVGPVTRVTLGARDVERVTVQFSRSFLSVDGAP